MEFGATLFRLLVFILLISIHQIPTFWQQKLCNQSSKTFQHHLPMFAILKSFAFEPFLTLYFDQNFLSIVWGSSHLASSLGLITCLMSSSSGCLAGYIFHFGIFYSAKTPSLRLPSNNYSTSLAQQRREQQYTLMQALPTKKVH